MRKRLIAVAVFTGWCFACWLHWRASVAIVPTWTLPLHDRRVHFAGNSSEPVLVAPIGPDESTTGPVEIIQPGDAPTLRRRLKSGDRLLVVKDRDASWAIIHRDGTLTAIDLNTDSTISTFAGVPEEASFRLADKGRVLLVQLSTIARGYDIATGTLLWEREGQFDVDQNMPTVKFDAGPAMTLRSTGMIPVLPSQRRRSALVSVTTGEEVDWLAALRKYRFAVASPCGRYVYVVVDATTTNLCDAKTGAVLWSVSPADPSGLGNGRTFSDDGEYLVADYVVRGSRLISQARWAAATGAVVTEPPKGGMFAGFPEQLDRAARYQTTMAPEGPVREAIGWAFKKLGLPWNFRRQQLFAMHDQQSNRQLGLITTSMDDYPAQYPKLSVGGPQGLLVQTRHDLKYYSAPPHRNWQSLFTWCLAPPLVIGFAWEVIRSLRRQFAASGDPPVAVS